MAQDLLGDTHRAANREMRRVREVRLLIVAVPVLLEESHQSRSYGLAVVLVVVFRPPFCLTGLEYHHQHSIHISLLWGVHIYVYTLSQYQNIPHPLHFRRVEVALDWSQP